MQITRLNVHFMDIVRRPYGSLANLFETSQLGVIVVNVRNMKGRKTDVKDAERIADLLQHGLLCASYIPKREQRELQELSRYRKSLIAERARELNRLQKMLEGGNIKLSSVVSNINGKRSRKLLQKLLKKEDPCSKTKWKKACMAQHCNIRRRVSCKPSTASLRPCRSS